MKLLGKILHQHDENILLNLIFHPKSMTVASFCQENVSNIHTEYTENSIPVSNLLINEHRTSFCTELFSRKTVEQSNVTSTHPLTYFNELLYQRERKDRKKETLSENRRGRKRKVVKGNGRQS